ncbi:MAG: MMPL family transporter, partial [Halorubrum sp.]
MPDDDGTTRSVLGRIGRTAASHRRAVFAGVLLLVTISVVGAAGVQMSLGMELYVDDDSQTMQDWEEIQADFDKGNVVFVVVETDDETDLYDPETQEQLSDLYQSYYDEVDAAALVTSPVHPVKAGPGGGEVPDTRADVLHSLNYSYNEHRSNMGVIANLHPDIQDTAQYPAIPDSVDQDAYPMVVEDAEDMFDGGDTGIVIVQYGDVEVPEDRDGELFGFLPTSEDEIVEEQLRETTVNADLDGVELTFTGTPVFEEAAFGMMLPEMIQLFAMAFGIILLLVVAIMHGRLRKTRRVALPLVTSLSVVLVMLGMMGFVGFDFNAIMLGVMPIALGLAIDYSLQIQTRYVEEREHGRQPIDAAEIAARTTGRSLAIVLGTTAVGLGSLLIADVPPVRQFGVTVVFSVLAAMVLSVTFLLALLVTFD